MNKIRFSNSRGTTSGVLLSIKAVEFELEILPTPFYPGPHFRNIVRLSAGSVLRYTNVIQSLVSRRDLAAQGCVSVGQQHGHSKLAMDSRFATYQPDTGLAVAISNKKPMQGDVMSISSYRL